MLGTGDVDGAAGDDLPPDSVLGEVTLNRHQGRVVFYGWLRDRCARWLVMFAHKVHDTEH